MYWLLYETSKYCLLFSLLIAHLSFADTWDVITCITSPHWSFDPRSRSIKCAGISSGISSRLSRVTGLGSVNGQSAVTGLVGYFTHVGGSLRFYNRLFHVLESLITIRLLVKVQSSELLPQFCIKRRQAKDQMSVMGGCHWSDTDYKISHLGSTTHTCFHISMQAVLSNIGYFHNVYTEYWLHNGFILRKFIVVTSPVSIT